MVLVKILLLTLIAVILVYLLLPRNHPNNHPKNVSNIVSTNCSGVTRDSYSWSISFCPPGFETENRGLRTHSNVIHFWAILYPH